MGKTPIWWREKTLTKRARWKWTYVGHVEVVEPFALVVVAEHLDDRLARPKLSCSMQVDVMIDKAFMRIQPHDLTLQLFLPLCMC